tara:strand:- start:17351 stop:18037 length:687 start_codon:yes stop_codon:yes gene_type:complete
MFTSTNVKNTIWFSLVIQLITGIIPLHSLFIDINTKHVILKDILILETVVQFIEMIFYIWIAFAVLNVKKMASRRYIDWIITTPAMLLSTIMFMEYQKIKERKNLDKEPIRTSKFLKDNKENIYKIFTYNLLMLISGFLGEQNIVPKTLTIPIGFIFFLKTFELIYNNYANTSVLGKQLFYYLFIVWALYGVAATFKPNIKNISYNLLDIVSKNFYGLFIYYQIMSIN